MEFSTVVLEKLKYAIITFVPEAMIDDIRTSEHVSFIANDFAIQLRGFIWAEEKSAQRQVVTYPLNWWQAFKERWAPKWALKKWPVQYKRVELDVKAIYPEFKQAMPDKTMRLTIIRSDGFGSNHAQ